MAVKEELKNVVEGMNLFEKMMKASEEMSTVAKNLTVDTGKSSYKAVSERDIIDAVKPVEAKYGIYSYPYSREIVESDKLEKTTQYRNDPPKTSISFYRLLKTVYRFVNVHKPEEYIDIVSFSTGLDTGDKAEGKAMTYGDKYALMKAYKISTGDDPDQEASRDEYKKAAEPMVTETNITALYIACENKGIPVEKVTEKYGKDAGELTVREWTDAMRRVNAAASRKADNEGHGDQPESEG